MNNFKNTLFQAYNIIKKRIVCYFNFIFFKKINNFTKNQRTNILTQWYKNKFLVNLFSIFDLPLYNLLP